MKKFEDISPCLNCHCMTKSIRKGRAYYVCGKCGKNKSLSDFFYKEKRIPICPTCNKPMKQAVDTFTGKKSKYLWKCKCLKGKTLSVG